LRGLRGDQVVQGIDGRSEEHGVAALAGFVTEGGGDVAFTDHAAPGIVGIELNRFAEPGG